MNAAFAEGNESGKFCLFSTRFRTSGTTESTEQNWPGQPPRDLCIPGIAQFTGTRPPRRLQASVGGPLALLTRDQSDGQAVS